MLLFLYLLFAVNSKGIYSSINNWVAGFLIISTIMSIFMTVRLTLEMNKAYKKPISSDLVTLNLKSDGFTCVSSKATVNFSFSDVEKLEPFRNQSLVIYFKKKEKNWLASPGLLIYSNAFKDKIDRDQFMKVFDQYIPKTNIA